VVWPGEVVEDGGRGGEPNPPRSLLMIGVKGI